MAALLDAPATGDHQRRVEQADDDMDNLRSAFGWSIESGDIASALELACSLQPLWLSRGRIQEGLGRDVADAIGDRFGSRQRCRWRLATAQVFEGDLAGSIAEFGSVIAECETDHDTISRVAALGVPTEPLK
jgi:hypothetical protein